MQWAVIADVHGNWEALQSVLDDLVSLAEPWKLLCLGDTVGYGANPNECLDRVRELTEVMVAGNHDLAAVDQAETAFFNPLAREAIAWTRRELSDANRKALRVLPYLRREGAALLVHATPCDPPAWEYLSAGWSARLQFDCFAEPVCFVGHSHVPLILAMSPEGLRMPSPQSVQLPEDHRFIVNVGSVGQPRDRDPRAAYGLFDPQKGSLTIRRVPYDVTTARTKIIRAGLPRELGDRLLVGE
jgi:diadenosine tetraphosphatase ApaH/serine/threonine PP2A family protein phosphatase